MWPLWTERKKEQGKERSLIGKITFCLPSQLETMIFVFFFPPKNLLVLGGLLDEFSQRTLDFLMFLVPVCLTCTVMEIFLLLFAIDWFYLMSAVHTAHLQGRSFRGSDCEDACDVCLGTRGAGTSPALSAIKIDQECCIKGKGCARLEPGRKTDTAIHLVMQMGTSHLQMWKEK